MLVRRIESWVGMDRFVAAGEVCDMPADLAQLHIQAGSAEPYAEPTAAPSAEPDVTTSASGDEEPIETAAPAGVPPASSGGRKRRG